MDTELERFYEMIHSTRALRDDGAVDLKTGLRVETDDQFHERLLDHARARAATHKIVLGASLVGARLAKVPQGA